MHTLKQKHAQTATAPSRVGVISVIVDHLVDALGGDPSCPLRRALILADIDENPGTTQADIMARLDLHKSALNRDVEWLYDHGCILRQPGPDDARAILLYTCGYAKNNLAHALKYFDGNHKSLKEFIGNLTKLFKGHKPTLRDAKILSVVGGKKSVTRQEIFDSLYNGPAATDNRAVNNLINFGMVQKSDE